MKDDDTKGERVNVISLKQESVIRTSTHNNSKAYTPSIRQNGTNPGETPPHKMALSFLFLFFTFI